MLEHETLAKQTVNGKEVGFDKYTPESGKDYYSNKGKLDTPPTGGELYDISKIIDSKVLDKGDLVASDNGKVYFVTDKGKLKTPDKGNGSTGGDNSGTGTGTGGSGNDGTGPGGSTGGTPGTGGEKEPEVKPEPNPESDFTWITNPYIGYDFPGKEQGYWKYTGTSKEVVIPEKLGGHTLTSYSYMFRSSPVTKVTSTSKEVVSMNYMFNGSQATTLDLSSFNTSNVTSMAGMFRESRATTLDLSSFNTSNVTDMAYMFGSSHATSIDLSSFNTADVNNMSYMFAYSQATSLNLINFDTSKVTDMSGMFSSSKATSLDLSSFNTSNVTDMGAMFGSSHATSLDLSNFDTSKVTDMSRMFHFSQATTGYARTQEDADKFNNSSISMKPSDLEFTVKQ